MKYLFVFVVSVLALETIKSVNMYWSIKKDWEATQVEKVRQELPELVEEHRGFESVFVS